MSKISPILLGLSLAVAGSSLAAAQDAATTPSIPMVLQITREYVKPYRAGMAHDKTESAFVAAFARAKFPAYYVGMDSMSGKSRALFFTQYASFADWEKATKILEKSPTLGAEIERAGIADGELLDELDSVAYTYDADLSYHPHPDISHARYMEISVFHVRPGHGDDWHKIAKLAKDAHDKAADSAHWAMFEIAYGAEDGTYIALTACNSMAEIDSDIADGKKFRDAIGDDGWKNLNDLFAATVDASHSELFSINPKQSYVSPDWIKADPDFWKPKAAEAAAKPTAKPTPAAAAKP
jgi:hypothetical protein